MATTNASLPPPPSLPTNGVITAAQTVGGNRKKQKRRAKQAAKVASQVPAPNPAPPPGEPADMEYDEDPLGYGEDDYEYSDAEPEQYHEQYLPARGGVNGYDPAPPTSRKKSKKNKAGGMTQHTHHAYNPDMLPPLPNPPPLPAGALRPMHRGSHNEGNIWNTSTAQERQNIKDFWLSLSEDERKSLLKIEKDAVLRKMKQQQKHSCSCTVCGRKRTAIEEELEVLYEGYYEELEQYAHHDHPPGLPSADALLPDPLQHRRLPPRLVSAPPAPQNPQHKTSHLHEHLDEDEFSDEEEYSDEEEEYSDEEPEPPRGGVPDFFNFGQNLTVKGILTPWLEKLQQGLKGKADNLLTVADDLLKNDGRKFIEMMEQLAERRMQRESEAEYAAANPSHPGAYPPNDPAYNHEDPMAAGDEFEDEEGSYDSQEEYDDDMEEEDEMGGLTEEQRMQEGRRMFQIFAARMFEQRVLNAYREKVAAERQQKLLEELQDEDKLAAEKEAKKQRDAAKKKEKKKQQQAAKAEEKAKRDAEKAVEEAKVREIEEKKLEEQRRKREEQRKKKEEEKRKQDEEKAKKEADRTRRLQEDQQRKDEAERKAREQKAAEKAKKEEARKREREEREAREREARERKAQEDLDRKEREVKAKAQKETKDREKGAQHASPQSQQPPQITKRPSQMGMVAVPGLYPKQPSNPGIASPHPSIATPAVPKAPTPAKPRQTSHQGSHASSPKQSQSQTSSAPSKSSSPGSSVATHQQQPVGQPKTIMQKPNSFQPGLQQHPMQTTSPLHQNQMQPAPGMSHPNQHPGGFGMPHMGFAGYQGHQGPMMHGNMPQRGPVHSMYPQQGPPMGVPNRMPFGPGMNGMPGPPPGMMQQGRGMGFPFDTNGPAQPPPGFNHPPPINHNPLIGHPPLQQATNSEASRPTMPTHSRQQSASDKERFEFAANQPIARPAPIQRPSSVKPQQDDRDGSSPDIDDLAATLGSKALLADDDDLLPSSMSNDRRHSGMQPPARGPPSGSFGPTGGFGSPVPGFAAPSSSSWSTPSLPFGSSSGLGQQNWNNLPNASVGGGWASNHNSFAANNAFSTIGAQMHRPSVAGLSRPLTIRLAVCQACKQLTSAARGETDGYHDVGVLLKQIEANRPMLDSAPSLREIEEICETEGDGGNGGGELYVRKSSSAPGGGNDGFAVKWEPDAGTPDQGRGPTGLGEIGSPMPSRTSPATGFGAPGMGRIGSGANAFQSLGAVGNTGF